MVQFRKSINKRSVKLPRAFPGGGSFRYFPWFPFLLGFVAFLTIVYDFGFDQAKNLQRDLDKAYVILLCLETLFIMIRYFVNRHHWRAKVIVFDFLLLFLIVFTLLDLWNVLIIAAFRTQYWLILLFLLIFLRELATIKIEFKRRYINPAQLFMSSFLGIILVGSIVLMFPNATYHGISFMDALFTSTSAVCVTGLAVVDTGTYFTTFGQVIILVLIQVGGLGIMTFTSYFSYFFTGESSYENQLMIQEMTNADKITEVFGTLKRVLLLTFIVEALGTIILYFSLDQGVVNGIVNRIFFALFHAVSAFCNAGFSTLTNGFAEVGFKTNYYLQLTIATLIIIGGLGFPILFNFFTYVKHIFKDKVLNKERVHMAWIININTRTVALTTFLLLLLGTLAFLVTEQSSVLSDRSGFGKVVTAFFYSVTARTAGFNTVDYSMLTLPGILICSLLMWIGASPSSTGGGIKTTTFAISLMNTISIARGKNRIELFGRELSTMTVRRAYSQIFMSILAIGTSVFLVVLFDKGLPLRSVIFECISAFSTVGLSLGITSSLSVAGKLVIIMTMFVGRISLLTLLSALFRHVRFQNYRYPKEDMLIN